MAGSRQCSPENFHIQIKYLQIDSYELLKNKNHRKHRARTTQEMGQCHVCNSKHNHVTSEQSNK